MKNEKMKLILPTLALSFFVFAGAAYAQTPTPATHQGFFGGLIQFIEQKFGLNHAQVQAAVKEYKTDRKATMTPRPPLTSQQITDQEKVRLDQMVRNGKITQAQEDAILAELATLRTKYNLDNLKSMTPDQRKTAMQNFSNDLKTWAQSQNINLQNSMPGFGMGRGLLMGRGHRMGNWDRDNDNGVTPTP